jgi:hypothetical protein
MQTVYTVCMSRRLITLKLDEDLAAWSSSHAAHVGCSRTALIAELLQALREGRVQIEPRAGSPLVQPEVAVPPPPTTPMSATPTRVSVAGLEHYLRAQGYFFLGDEAGKALADRMQKGFTERTQHGCLVRPGKASFDAYPNLTYKGKRYTAHRVSFALYKDPIPPGRMVCHLCDRKQCVNPSHLRLGTALHNAQDRSRKTGGTKRPAPPTNPSRWAWPPGTSQAFPGHDPPEQIIRKLRAFKEAFPQAFTEEHRTDPPPVQVWPEKYKSHLTRAFDPLRDSLEEREENSNAR